jgi:Prokaryotic membrane lipoprotein lipid attachment site
MMKRVIAVALAAAALAGCSHNRGAYKPPAAKLLRPASTSPSTVITTPTPASGLDWFMTAQGGQAKLAYGAPNSDDVHLMMVCSKGSGKLSVSRTVTTEQAGAPPILALASGTARGRWLATAAPSAEQSGHTQLNVNLTTTEPAIDAFDRNGWITAINADGKTEGMAPQPGENAVRRFFDFCG